MKLLVIPRPESHTPAHLDPPEVVLEQALALALPAAPVPPQSLKSTTYRTFTRRGTVFVGKKCNLRCHFCCYLDRVEDRTHPEHEFISLAKAKALCKTLVDVFGRNAVDIQGGEPTIYPHILPLIEYCNEIGLRPTLITNALVLDRMERVLEFKKSGVYDFLVSVQGLGAVYDTVVGMEGAHVRQMKGLRNIAEAGIPFRFNTVMTKAVVLHLPQVATLAVRTGARVVNYLMYSPQDDQVTAGTRTANNVARYTEVSGPLTEALDILAAAGVEANVRFFPYCLVPERHRPSLYNYAQIQYDHHDWDFASTAWTDAVPQRLSSDELAEPTLEVTPLGRPDIRLRLGPVRRLRRLLPESARLDGTLGGIERALVRASQTLRLRGALELSDEDEKAKALEYAVAARETSYAYSGHCRDCDAKAICDGLHADSAAMFGADEVRPIRLGFKTADPTFFIREQAKTVEPEDESWALCPREALVAQLTHGTANGAGPKARPAARPAPAADVPCLPIDTWGAVTNVSVIIPTFRRPHSLRRTLDSLQDQLLSEFEIIVADNAADRETEEMVREFNRTAWCPAQYVGHPHDGVTGARHRAVQESRGDLLVFTDDDATFAPEWLAAHVQVYADSPETAAAAGPIRLAWEAPPPQWLLDYLAVEDDDCFPWRQTLLTFMDRRTTFQEDDNVVFYSVNMSIRREVLVATGGFNPEAYGDVWLGDGEGGLNRKLWACGAVIQYVPEALVYHHIPPQRMTPQYLCRRWANEGACDAYAEFHPVIPSRPRLAAYAVEIAVRNAANWGGAWWRRGRSDRRSLDIQLQAARSQSKLKYITRLMVRKWARELVLKQYWLDGP